MTRETGLGADLGTGKIADLITIDGDPLAEPDLLNRPDRILLVIKNGKVVKTPMAECLVGHHRTSTAAVASVTGMMSGAMLETCGSAGKGRTFPVIELLVLKQADVGASVGKV